MRAHASFSMAAASAVPFSVSKTATEGAGVLCTATIAAACCGALVVMLSRDSFRVREMGRTNDVVLRPLFDGSPVASPRTARSAGTPVGGSDANSNRSADMFLSLVGKRR